MTLLRKHQPKSLRRADVTSRLRVSKYSPIASAGFRWSPSRPGSQWRNRHTFRRRAHTGAQEGHTNEEDPDGDPAAVTAHGLRHSFATTAVETCEIPLRRAKHALWHASPGDHRHAATTTVTPPRSTPPSPTSSSATSGTGARLRRPGPSNRRLVDRAPDPNWRANETFWAGGH